MSDNLTSYVLFVFRSPPYGSNNAREGIDAALATAVFDQPLKLLFMNDGVFQLLTNQTHFFANSVEKQLKALSLYGIDEVYVHEPSVRQRNLAPDALQYNDAMICSERVRTLLAEASHILSF